LKKLRCALVLGILGALLGAGCGNGTSTPSSPVISTPTTANSLVFSASIPHGRNARGTSIPVTFTITNSGTQAANLTYGGCHEFVIQITQGTRQIWWGPGASEACLTVPQPSSIAAGATQTYTVDWDQRDLPNNVDQTGTQVAPGPYIIVAKFIPVSLNGIPMDSGQLAKFATSPISVTITP